MRISISALSKSFSLSDEALRFYERKGLLRPDRVNDRGYRVFERVDIQRVGNIKRLQNEGFQLAEIRKVYSGVSSEDMFSLMARKKEELDWEIRYKTLISRHMQFCLQKIEQARTYGEAPRLCAIDSVYMRLYNSIEELWARVEESDVLKKLFCHLPLSSFTTLIAFSALKTPDCPQGIRKGVLISEEAARLLLIDLTDNFEKVEAGKSVSCVVHLENGQFLLEEAASKILSFLKREKLSSRGDAFTRQILNFNDVDGTHRHYTELLVPVL